MIEIDIPNRTLNIKISDQELAARIQNWKAPAPRVTEGFLTVYARLANPAETGAGINLRLKKD
jgi:dihydroxy-acid dehydratase